jgi:4-hydroxyacetophenone monooxygenase
MSERLDVSKMTEAVAIANVPTLLMVLVQLTGELRWLHPPYRPKRPRGMSDNDTGGLPDSVQTEIRAAVLDAILAWRSGRPIAIPSPSRDLRLRMLACAMAEEIPRDYDSIIEAELPEAQEAEPDPVRVPEGFHALVIGAGVSGLCAAVNLKRSGVGYTEPPLFVLVRSL